MGTKATFLLSLPVLGEKVANSDHGVGTTDVNLAMRRYNVGAEVLLDVNLPAHTGGLLVVSACSGGSGDPTHANTYIKVYAAGVLVHDAPVADFQHSTLDMTTGHTVYVGAIPAGSQTVQVRFKYVSYVQWCACDARVLGALP